VSGFPLSSIAIVSIVTTRALVSLGLGLGYDPAPIAAGAAFGRFTSTGSPAPLAITAASNTTPIVITTAYPHGVSARTEACGGLSCVISGVLGNTAANNVATDPNDREVGLPQGVLAVPLSASTLALYGQDQGPASPTVGSLVPLVGNGAYAGGGTIVPAFTDGSILIGRPTTREHSAPPRLCFVPLGVASSQRRSSSPNPATRNGERRALIRERSIGTDTWTFTAHAWGEATPPDQARDFVLAATIREALRAALHDLACGTADEGGGAWDDQREREVQQIKAGHLLSFAMSIAVPVTDNPSVGGLPFVPDGTYADVTVQSTTPEIAETFEVGPINPA
jgi:hypothetical protein